MVIIVALLFVKQSMNYNYIILRFIYITLLYYIILYYIIEHYIKSYSYFTTYLQLFEGSNGKVILERSRLW